ncbi:Uncharacterised protein [Vibrio cholerae]|nr:Uncharacterised protein [Vibrio cholerae]
MFCCGNIRFSHQISTRILWIRLNIHRRLRRQCTRHGHPPCGMFEFKHG